MKSLFHILFLIIALTANAQSKKLTIEDCIIGSLDQYKPESLSDLQWNNSEDFYSYKNTNQLIICFPESKNKVIMIDKTLLENELTEYQIQLRVFPDIVWVSSEVFRFTTGQKIVYFNYKSNRAEAVINIPVHATNLVFNDVHKMIAYSLHNNFYIAGADKTITITNDSVDGIVNGVEVHRREFGITKGSFWASDGSAIAFYRKDESMVTKYPILNISPQIAETKEIRYPMAGMNSHQVTIGVYNLISEKLVFLNTGVPEDQYLTNLVWDLQCKSIYIAHLNREQNLMELKKYNATDGSFIHTLFTESNSKYIEPETPPYFLPWDDSKFIWISRNEGFKNLYLYDIQGNLIKKLTNQSGETDSISGFDKLNKIVFFHSNNEDPRNSDFYAYNFQSDKTQRITWLNGNNVVKQSPSGKWILNEFDQFQVPKEIYLKNLSTDKTSLVLRSENPYKEFDFGTVNYGTIKAADDTTTLYYRMTLPQNFNPEKKYPVIVYVYNGPHVQLVTNSWYNRNELWQQYMAQEGYIGFTIDGRGSNKRGLEFENVIFRKLGQEEMKDQVIGVKYLSSLPYVDKSRIGVFGWSYGGFMTISLMLNYPDLFKAGVSGGPVTDWQLYEIMYGERYMDMPQNNQDGYNKTNVCNHVGNLKGKLLVIHGGEDPTVVQQHSLQFIRECIKADKPIDYFVYPTHEHNVTGRDRVHLMKKVSTYFFDYL